ncbi:LuxR family transcriptional regulator [Rhizobium leguminosarum]|uniref:ATP-binding protein n=1 Tax=Rhizobium leguminosarum TaxID=384 RepID=UPI00102F6C2B|nr:winged helix-turn-helix domain-containing protein [Rhizobium leguminosarum]TAX43825.1 LuxR family transcriptional regulator [Rhizobium leguminosarum]TAX47267.1 LuxR family transcriptional regulator [Rhizobium leguminosarum]TAX85802.1 LuxR family transcriptional regulator [Rhizobium leguminosarum]
MGQIEIGLFEHSGWELDLEKRELRAMGAPIPLGSRAFEILETLAVSGGIVTKDELMKRVWPGLVVEENTLQVHISAIRRALGKDRDLLRTVSGRGYRLLGEWTEPETRFADPMPAMRVPSSERGFFVSNIPSAASELIGREAAVSHIVTLMSAYRIVTLTGPGGIGKTVLASEVARRLQPTINGDAIFVELVSLSDPNLVPTTLAQALDLHLQGDDISAELVARAIGSRKMLLLIDNCEHVVDAAAEMVEAIVRACQNVSVLATSRELLRIEGEFTYRVPPLDVPGNEQIGDPLQHSAVQLFVARTRALQSDFTMSEGRGSVIAGICRHLDGIPLAIEFAAARAATLGLQQIAGRLDDRFVLLTGGRRTALPRHRTLRAALDWSYELLPEGERRLLRNLAVYPAGFTLEAAMAASGEDEEETALGLSNLVSKSLVTFEGTEAAPRWRLLETVRVYSLEKLGVGADYRMTMRRSAAFFQSFFRPFSNENSLQVAIEGLGPYRREIDNLRAALTWALSPDGDGKLGAGLAAVASDFWTATSLVSEAGEWAQKALSCLEGQEGGRTEMVLQCALGFALIYTQGMSEQGREVLTRALSLAETLDDPDYRQRVTCALWLFSARSVELKDALVYAHEYEKGAGGRDARSRATAAWLTGIPQTYQAKHLEAHERLGWAAKNSPSNNRRRDMLRLGADIRTSSMAHNTVNLISLGRLDAASLTAGDSVLEARATKQPFVCCVALAWASAFVSLSLDNEVQAREWGEELIAHAMQHGLKPFYAVGLCVRGSLASRSGSPAEGIEALRSGLRQMQEASYLLFYPFFMCELAAALQADGRFDEALVEIDVAQKFSADKSYRWIIPELLRKKGEIIAAQGANESSPVKLFQEAGQTASSQGGLYWELTAGMSHVEYLASRGERRAAQKILLPIYERFSEGFFTPRLLQAKILLGTDA